MTQEEIIIDNLKTMYLLRHYRTSPFKSLGNVLSYLYICCGFNVMEQASVGEYEVTIRGARIATFTFDEKKVMPVFIFEADFNLHRESRASQKILIENIDKFREEEKQLFKN